MNGRDNEIYDMILIADDYELNNCVRGCEEAGSWKFLSFLEQKINFFNTSDL